VPPVRVSPLLKWSVIIMGVLLVVGFVVVISTIIIRAVKLSDRPETADSAAALLKEVAIPAGSEVAGVTLDGNRMAVRVRGAGGEEILLFDARSGALSARIRLKPQ